MSPAEVTEKLGLHRMRDRSWFVHPSCATSGEVSSVRAGVRGGRSNDEDQEGVLTLALPPLLSSQGLFEGLSWLSANVKKQPN